MEDLIKSQENLLFFFKEFLINDVPGITNYFTKYCTYDSYINQKKIVFQNEIKLEEFDFK